MAERLVGTRTVVIDGKEFKVTRYAGEDDKAFDRAYDRLISSLLKKYDAERLQGVTDQ